MKLRKVVHVFTSGSVNSRLRHAQLKVGREVTLLVRPRVKINKQVNVTQNSTDKLSYILALQFLFVLF